MVFELIAEFFENSNQDKPTYRVPINVITVNNPDEMLQRGFIEDENSTDGYLDFLCETDEEDIHNWTDEKCVPELLDVIFSGIDYDRIIIRAFETEFFDGEMIPRAVTSENNKVYFTGSSNEDSVIFCTGAKCFGRPITVLKKKFNVKTMFELMDIMRDYINREKLTDEDLRMEFGAGIDDAIRVATNKFYSMTDFDGNPAVLHALEVGRAGSTKEEKIVGYLHDVIEDTGTEPEELYKLGFTEEVMTALDLCTHDEDMTYDEYIDKIIQSKNETAIAVKINDLTHNIERGLAAQKRAEADGDIDTLEDITRINKKHEDALDRIKRSLNVDQAFLEVDLSRYRYFHGEKDNPYKDKPQGVFWDWERMYCHSVQLQQHEEEWEKGGETILEELKTDRGIDDPTVARISTYSKETLGVFYFIYAMKYKWFPMMDEEWELEY